METYKNLKDVMKSEESKKWSRICRNMIESVYLDIINMKVVEDKKIHFNIIIRDDGRVTVSTVEEDRNIVTLYMNKTEEYLSKIEIRYNGKKEKRQVNSINDIQDIMNIVNELLNDSNEVKGSK
ncbi:hypothetical protein [Clostridium coskatii]|uniref:Uncharacterized protein n=1 Tax=Clostridium coskatii TaxID=1705578 RepID=A0A162J5T4_9CLOT|nr:hypothetical protein [Clostridium coskatii]OAA90715.1 hypothetical protein WX73_02080 [Clostridium coskatii]OBR97449.1 hypothetical protein CLCOS_03050 [Clostridium coskatii]